MRTNRRKQIGAHAQTVNKLISMDTRKYARKYDSAHDV